MAPRRTALLYLVATLAVVVLAAGACSKSVRLPVADAQTVPTSPPTTVKPPDYRQVVWASVPKVQIFADPSATTPMNTLPNPTVEKQPLAFLAVGQQPDWLQVRLPTRPNSVTGWVHTSDVRLGDIPQYRVLVEIGAHRLTLFKGDDVVMQEPVGTGTARTPTPTGSFYVDAMVKLNNPNTVWGPYQMSVSGFSNVLDRFMGGPGQIAIHGTNAPQLIPGDISNGCVRMHNDAITKLATLTGIGTPVDIVA